MKTEWKKEEAVSPVVGVMLMLVVTIIIAAVVSGFAGGLASTESKAPTASIEAHVVNTGDGHSKFILKVLSVSEPIPTKDLKLVTSYVLSDGTRGGATCLPNSDPPNVQYNGSGSSLVQRSYNSPLGYGPGVGAQVTASPFKPDQFWGNYTWVSGTQSQHFPANYSNYVIGNIGTDGMQAILGNDWNKLRVGDKLNIKVVHTPSGKTIVDKTIMVEE